MKSVAPVPAELYVATIEQPASELLATPRGGTHPLENELRRLTVAVLEERLQKMLRRADETLIDMSERAESPAQQHAHFDAMRILELEKATLLRRFRQEIERAFDALQAPASRTAAGHVPLLPDQELEENVQASRMAARSKMRHKEQLAEVEQRLDMLVRDLGLQIGNRPLSPARICQAWRSAMDPLDLAFNVRRVFMQLFERLVMDDLGELYQAALSTMQRMGSLQQ
ncbi:MAG TPA: DUF1631 family protein, partial [Nevskiaceae bacterium]|nr:DUF1631 family protein [Nevskiaceae bacterium]